MAERCGDKAKLDFEVTSELVGKMAHIWVIRDYAEDFAGTHEEVLKKAENKEISWPDQEKEDKEGEYCSGRMADFRGLDKKSYKDKMDAQRFELRIYINEKHNQSNDSIWIDGYADAQEDFTGTNAKGVPLSLVNWESSYMAKVIMPDGKKKKVRKPRKFKAGDTRLANCGSYNIELKDGVVTITVKVDIEPAPGSKQTVDTKVFDYIKKRVEGFWNSSSSGFLQWVYHRTGCKRGDICRCSVIMSGGKVVQAGCCKFPLLVKLERGGSSDNKVYVHFTNPLQRILGYESLKDFLKNEPIRADTMTFYYPEDGANTYAHEVGHMMGFPDQYRTGHVDAGAVDAKGKSTGGGLFPIDDASIMGGGQTKVQLCHIEASWIKDWVASKTDGTGGIKPISKK